MSRINKIPFNIYPKLLTTFPGIVVTSSPQMKGINELIGTYQFIMTNQKPEKPKVALETWAKGLQPRKE